MRLFVTALLRTFLVAISLCSALTSTNPAWGQSANGGDDQQFTTAYNQAPDLNTGAATVNDGDWDQDGPAWTITADALFLTRSHDPRQTILSDQFSGSVILDAADLKFDTAAGPRISIIRHGGESCDLEVAYFSVLGIQAKADFDSFANPTILHVDTGLDPQVDSAHIRYTTSVYNTEINLRKICTDWWTTILGFRWVEVYDRYRVTGNAISSDDEEGQTISPYTHSIDTGNRMYGGQIGADILLCNKERWQINTVIKAGIYENYAEQHNVFNNAGGLGFFEASATGTQAAFLGEITLNARYSVSDHIALRGGYNFMWIDGLALATKQISSTTFGGTTTANTHGDILFQGAHVGVEVVW